MIAILAKSYDDILDGKDNEHAMLIERCKKLLSKCNRDMYVDMYSAMDLIDDINIIYAFYYLTPEEVEQICKDEYVAYFECPSMFRTYDD